MKKNTTTILALLFLLVLTIACDPQSLDGPNEPTGYGYIRLGISAQPEVFVTTRGATDVDDLLITLVKDDGTAVWENITYANLKEPQIVEAGTYTITASNVESIEAAYSANDGLGQARIASESQTLTVNAGGSTEVTLDCKPKNAKVTFKYTEAFKAAFPGCTAVTLNQTSPIERKDVSLPLSLSSESDAEKNLYAAFFEPGSVTWKLNLNKDGITNTPYGTTTAEAGKWTIVTLDAKTDSNGSLTLSVEVDGTVQEITINQGFNPYKLRQ